MTTRSSPTVKRMAIAAELRRLRTLRGISAADASRKAAISTSALSRVESAESATHPTVVDALLRFYGVAEDDITWFVELAKQARKRGWWAPYKSVLPAWFDTYIGLESDACKLDKYETQLIPGLLQTEDYARAIITSGFLDTARSDIERRVELRMQRQKRQKPIAIHAVLDEAVLRRVVGSARVMRAQLERVHEAASDSNNRIQILPFSAGEHGAMGSGFSILSFPDVRYHNVVYVETCAGSLYLEEDAEIALYDKMIDRIRDLAVDRQRSLKMISDAIRAL